MSRAYLTIYNEISIDGRVEGFSQDAIRYYRRGFRWRSDAILMGSVTAQNFGPPESPQQQALEIDAPAQLPIVAGFDDLVYEPRPLLVVPDSRGEVRNWIHALAQPWYRSFLVLASANTPAAYLDYLQRRRIDHLIAGDLRVDLTDALARLNTEYGVRSIRTDSGGALNGALLAAGLVDEIALIVNPSVSGEVDSQSLMRLPQAVSGSGIPLQLFEVERLDDGSVWLRYTVSR